MQCFDDPHAEFGCGPGLFLAGLGEDPDGFFGVVSGVVGLLDGAGEGGPVGSGGESGVDVVAAVARQTMWQGC